jgi:peptidoglycan hydrolase-like protein with peptidoglycan-binding domain
MFPEYLNVGSGGAAVLILQVWLKATIGRFLPETFPYQIDWAKLTKELECNGSYNESTRWAVEVVQMYLNDDAVRRDHSKPYDPEVDEMPSLYPLLDRDGNFGPATRAAIKAVFGIDFNNLEHFTYTQAKFPKIEKLVRWPPEV